LAWFPILAVGSAVAIVFPAVWGGAADPAPAFVYVFFAWVGSVGIWLAWYTGRRRKLALATLSEQLGMTFVPRVPAQQLEVYQGASLFREDGFAENLMQGRYGDFDVLVLDYQYDRGAGHGRTHRAATWRQTVVIFPKAARLLPTFQLWARESIWSKSIGVSNRKDEGADLRLGTVPAKFAANYKVVAPSNDSIDAVFTSQVLNFFAQNPGWDVEVADNHVIVYQENQLVAPSALPGRIEQSMLVLKTFLGSRASN
jgi:hypothetical protein